MRIRNSRPSFPPPETDSRSTHLRSRRGANFDYRFLVEETSRRIGWSCDALRKPSSPDVEKARPPNGLLPAIDGETKLLHHVEQKNEKENGVPEMPSHVISFSFLPFLFLLRIWY